MPVKLGCTTTSGTLVEPPRLKLDFKVDYSFVTIRDPLGRINSRWRPMTSSTTPKMPLRQLSKVPW